MDRSGAVSRQCYFYNKKAIIAALLELKPKDTFNIIIFGGPLLRFSEQTVEWSAERVKEAIHFLESQNHGGAFVVANLAKLLNTLAFLPNSHENQTALLFSTGDIYLSLEKQRQILGRFTQQNNRQIALFCLASGENNNATFLEQLAGFNKGQLIFTNKHQEIVERTVELIRSLSHPIGHHLSLSINEMAPHTTILLQPQEKRLPDLYLGRPLTIYGSTNRLSDFVLTLEFEANGEKHQISQPIQLTNAKSGSFSIESKWMQLAVQEFYKEFFEDGNPKHLEIAKELLTPLNLPVAFLK